MNKSPSLWVKAIQNGLIGGGISLLLGLIGIVVAFERTYIISGLFTMAHVFFLAPYLMESYSTVRKANTSNRYQILAAGALSGLMSSIVLVVAIALQEAINIRSILINFSAALISLWTFHLPLVAGLLVLLLVGVITGLVSAVLFLLPDRIRAALSQAVLIIVILGLFRDLIVTVITRWGAIEKGLIWLFAQSGLSIIGAVVIFILVFASTYWRKGRGSDRPLIQPRNPREARYYRWSVWALLGIIAIFLPTILGPYFSEILDQVGIYILMGLGLNIVVGFAGLLDLGYVAFYAIGAYTLGILTTTEAVGIMHTNFWVAAPIAIVIAVFAGVLLGLPILRLRGDYLAIVTLGFGEIIRILVLSDWLKPRLGGSEGIQRIVQPSLFGYVLNNQQKLYYLIIFGILIAGFISVRLKASHLGRSWMALREDEDVAEAMGINKVITKLLAFAMGALFSGLGGAIFATKIGSVYPQSFSFIVSINILSLIIIGGMGSIPGVFIGGLALVGLPLLLSQFADFRYLIYGAALVFMMLVKPEGLAPEERRRLELHEETEEIPYDEPAATLNAPEMNEEA